MRLRTAAACWFLGAAALYGATAARGLIWADSSKLTIYALHSYFPSLNPGDHPGWTVLARVWLWLTPFWTPVRSLHLFSAFCGAVAVAALFLVVARKTACWETAHTAATLLLVAHPHWWASTVTETYSLALALSLLAILAALGPKPQPVLAGLLAGLAVACHGFSVFLLLPVLVGLRRSWVLVGAGVLLGTIPLWMAVFSGVPADPMTGFSAGGAASWVWHMETFVAPNRWFKGAAILGGLLLYALGPVGLFSALTSIRDRRWRKADYGFVGAISVGLLFLVLATYSAFRLHLMVVFLFTGFLLITAPRFGRLLRIGHAGSQILIYLLFPILLTSAGNADLGVRQLPGRNNAEYFLRPARSSDLSAEGYGRSLLDCVPSGGVVLSDFNPGAVLKLLQETEGIRRDVLIIPTAVDGALASNDPAMHLAAVIDGFQRQGKATVLADGWPAYYRTGELEERFGLTLEPCGPGLMVVSPAVLHSTEVPLPNERAHAMGSTKTKTTGPIADPRFFSSSGSDG